MNHRTILALMFVAGIGSAVAADLHWNGAGWYGIADDVDWGWIVTGPYSDEQSCKASLPQNYDEVEHYCEYLATKPAWD